MGILAWRAGGLMRSPLAIIFGIVDLALLLIPGAALAQSEYPTVDGKNSVTSSVTDCVTTPGVGAPCQHGSAFTSVSSSSGNKAAATATATLAASTTQLTFICGLSA